VQTAYSLYYSRHAETTDESRWLCAARAGEPWGLEQFYNCYYEQVYALCRRLLGGCEDDARDATQTTFVRAFRELPRFRGESTARTWLYRIAVNESLTVLRKRRAAPQAVEGVEPAGAADPDVVERVAVQAALGRVKPAHRAVLVLRYWEGLGYEEIAGVLGISLSAAKMRLKRARDEFRRYYEDET
jgi:RNA polymerase sigma-70 factor, ECF subfamily